MTWIFIQADNEDSMSLQTEGKTSEPWQQCSFGYRTALKRKVRSRYLAYNATISVHSVYFIGLVYLPYSALYVYVSAINTRSHEDKLWLNQVCKHKFWKYITINLELTHQLNNRKG
jgi:hypothetical protein